MKLLLRQARKGLETNNLKLFGAPMMQMDDSKLLWSDIQKNVCGWSEGRDKEEG